MAKKIRIVEEDLAPGVWGQVISISAEDEDSVLEKAERYIKRRHVVELDGAEIKKSVADILAEKRRVVKPK
ncbi:MAG: hypothetical protein HA494_08210 [Thaumarchaeota archaeon]|nr:hypothetical protein [Nitrososphaerota archaeon]